MNVILENISISSVENMRLYVIQLMCIWFSRRMNYHCCDVIMDTMASQFTSLAIVYSTVYLGTDQRKYQSSASLAFVRGIHRGPMNSPHKWPVTRKMFQFYDVIMFVILSLSSSNRNLLLRIRLWNKDTCRVVYSNCNFSWETCVNWWWPSDAICRDDSFLMTFQVIICCQEINEIPKPMMT